MHGFLLHSIMQSLQVQLRDITLRMNDFLSYSIKTEESNLLVGQAAPRDYLSAYFAGMRKVQCCE